MLNPPALAACPERVRAPEGARDHRWGGV